jgi:hypothetical protein
MGIESESKFWADHGYTYNASRYLQTQDPKKSLNLSVRIRAGLTAGTAQRVDHSRLGGLRGYAYLEDVIAAYSKLQLSFAKDHLPSLDSLMANIESVSGKPCCMGMCLWEIQESLFWWPMWWDERNLRQNFYNRPAHPSYP